MKKRRWGSPSESSAYTNKLPWWFYAAVAGAVAINGSILAFLGVILWRVSS